MKALQGLQQNPGSGDTTWDGSRTPPAGNAGLGIYSFQVTHTHAYGTHPGCSIYGECGPQSDKPGALTIEDVSYEDLEFEIQGLFIGLRLSYSLTRLASVCRVTLYGVDAGKRDEDHSADPFENLGTKALPRGAGPHTQLLTWYRDPRPYYWYWVVIEAKENASVARLYNRDRQPKWAVPKGFGEVFRPVAWNIAHNGIAGRGDPWISIAETAKAQQAALADVTGYNAYSGEAMDATEAAGKFEHSALWYFVGHGAPGFIATHDWGAENEVDLLGTGGSQPIPPNDRVSRHDLGSCLLVVFDSCSGGYPSPHYGLLPEIAVQQGADCAVAFSNLVWSSSAWTLAFWGTLAQGDYGANPAPVWLALEVAEGTDPLHSRGAPAVVRGNQNLAIRPARYGTP